MELKERTIYIAALKNGDTENFFGAVVSSEGADQILNVTNLDPSAPGNALLEVALQGLTSAAHRVKVFLNDAEVMEMRFDGVVRKVMSVALPHSWLLEGENLVSLVAQGGEADVSALDYIRLTYWHTYTAEQDYAALLFIIRASGGHQRLHQLQHPCGRHHEPETGAGSHGSRGGTRGAETIASGSE